MSDLARVAPAPAAKKQKRAPAPAAKKEKTRPRTRSKKKKKNAPPPPLPLHPPPPNCASVFKALIPSPGHHASIVFANGGGRAAPRPTPPLLKTTARFSADDSCPSLSCGLGFANGGGCAPPQPPRFLKPCQLASKQRNPFRTHHESIPPRLKRGGGGGLCFLAGQTCFNHTNPFHTHDDASIVFCAPPQPPRFF